MKKEKKKSVLTRIIPYAGKRKYMLFLAMAFSALSGILLLMPMWYIHNIIKNVILNGNVNYTMIRENIAYAVIFPCVGLGLYVLAGIFSHLFAFEVEENIIKISVKKLLDKPLGYFMNKESGKLRGIIINGAGETHNVLAHQLPDIASTFVSPVVILVFLFLFDWRLGLTSLTICINQCLNEEENCNLKATDYCPVRRFYLSLQEQIESELKHMTFEMLRKSGGG